MKIDLKSCFGAAIALALVSCSEGSTHFDAKYAPGFHEGPATISVLGVYHEGRMSTEAWGEVGPVLSASLGGQACEAGFGDKLQGKSPELFAEVDESTRSEGITEELLEKLSPSAEGELLMVVSIHGRMSPGKKLEGGIAAASTGSIPQPGRGSRMRGGRSPSGRGTLPDEPEIGIAATLFSAKLHRSVARVSMIYVGTNLDDALGKFIARVGEVVPGSTCKGWKWIERPAAAP